MFLFCLCHMAVTHLTLTEYSDLRINLIMKIKIIQFSKAKYTILLKLTSIVICKSKEKLLIATVLK